MSNATPTILRTVVMGATSWSAEEWRTVRAFRGSRTATCAVKDAAGKLAEAATRRVIIRVVCADGVVYRFEHDAAMTVPGDGSKSLVIHGQAYDVNQYTDFPAAVMAAHAKASRKVKACLRILRAEVAALPVFRPIATAKNNATK